MVTFEKNEGRTLGKVRAEGVSTHQRTKICCYHRKRKFLGQSEEAFEKEHQTRMEKNLHRRAKELGYVLTKIEEKVDEEAEAKTAGASPLPA